jgi:hypothetical protein
MENQLTTREPNMQEMANSIAASGMFGLKSPAQAMTLMMLAKAEGRHPMTVIQDYHIIQNRPALKADAILARFQKSGGRVEWLQLTESVAEGKFTHPEGGSATILWSLVMAQKAGLTKNPTWASYPRPMLRSRTIAEGVRTVYPAVLCGMYTPEEMEDVTMREEVSLAATMPESAPLEISPDEVEHKKRMKYLRGKLNQGFMACGSEQEIREACKVFQREQGVKIWEEFTTHNGTETFRSLTDEHMTRVAEKSQMDSNLAAIKADYLERLKACADPILFDELSAEYEETFVLKKDEEVLEALQTKGRDDFGMTYGFAEEIEA